MTNSLEALRGDVERLAARHDSLWTALRDVKVRELVDGVPADREAARLTAALARFAARLAAQRATLAEASAIAGRNR